MKVLVVRTSSIGDVVHVLPALAALHHAGNEVSWLVEPASKVLLEGNPLVSRVVRVPAVKAYRVGEAVAALKALRAERCDVALDFQGLWKSAAWAKLSGAGRVIGYGRAWRREAPSSILLDERVELPAAAVHVIDKNLALLRAIGIDALGLREFPLPATPESASRVEAA
ncbi:MAG TPA: glycosyltransferase family 9 protein, partial [Vicinamibacteria bacterium]